MLLMVLMMYWQALEQCDSRKPRDVPCASTNPMAEILSFTRFVSEFVGKLIGATAQCDIDVTAPAGIECSFMT